MLTFDEVSIKQIIHQLEYSRITLQVRKKYG